MDFDVPEPGEITLLLTFLSLVGLFAAARKFSLG
jgi:hypothetical protein